MAGETDNLAQMAEKVAKEIFTIFGWKEVGARNQNWDCVHNSGHVLEKPDEEQKPKSDEKKKAAGEEDSDEAAGKKTHPSDMVCFYEDPYGEDRIYFNIDLKSYGKSSIKKSSLRNAIEDLAYSTECANIGSGWSELYAKDVTNRKTVGLLFIYNHDNEYDPDKFDSILSKIDPQKIHMAKGNRLHIIGPRQVAYLATVAHDIGFCRGNKDTDGNHEIPDAEECSFYYPDLITIHPHAHNHPSATIEMLLSPWQVLRFSKPNGKKVKTHYYFYYSGAGDSIDEFKYLIDYFFRYQLLDDAVEISIRMPFAHSNASTLLEQAKDAYAQSFYDLGEFKARLKRISFYPISNVIKTFSTIKIGMERREA